MNYLLIMFLTFLIFFIIFFILQFLYFRNKNYNNLPTHFNIIIIMSVFFTGTFSYYFLIDYYTVYSTFLTSTIGSICSAAFLAGFYSFAGPICADRSLSVHILLITKYSKENDLYIDDLLNIYNNEKVILRRLDEMSNAGVISISNDSIKVTPKGEKISIIYESMINYLGLKRKF